MKINYLFIAILMLCSAKLNAQWDSVTSFNQVIADIKTFDGKLFIGGNFTKNENNTCNWSAYYDGNSITRHTYTIGGSGVRSFDVFDSELYAVGSMQHSFGIGVSKWDGSTWVNGGSTNYSHSTIYADNNSDLYVVGDDGLVRKKSAGGSFQNFLNVNGGISSIIRYGNELIFAGTFDTINGIAASNIARWDGSNWMPIGDGVSKGTRCMAVFNNELYVAGKISTAGGGSVKNIAKWDGSNWSDVGGGMTGTSWNGIRDMTAYNDRLYVVGDFTEMGGVKNTHDVARWDGIQWSAMNLVHDDFFVNCVEVYNNKLFVGTFDFDRSHLFVYGGTLGTISETVSVETDQFKVFPNPVLDHLNIEMESSYTGRVNVEVIDVLGNVVIRECFETYGNTGMAVNCSNLNRGAYIVLIRRNDSSAIRMRDKIIVD